MFIFLISLIKKTSSKGESKQRITSNGLGGWQVAGTNNIHMNIVDLQTKKVKFLSLPTIYFGLPVSRANGEFYSPNTAAMIAADAVEYAEQEVMEYYHSLGGSLQTPAMTLYYRQKISEYMQRKGGSATLTPGGNIEVDTFGLHLILGQYGGVRFSLKS